MTNDTSLSLSSSLCESQRWASAKSVDAFLFQKKRQIKIKKSRSPSIHFSCTFLKKKLDQTDWEVISYGQVKVVILWLRKERLFIDSEKLQSLL